MAVDFILKQKITRTGLSVESIETLVKSGEISLDDAKDMLGKCLIQQFTWEEGTTRPRIPSDWDGISEFFVLYMNEEKLETILRLDPQILSLKYNYYASSSAPLSDEEVIDLNSALL